MLHADVEKELREILEAAWRLSRALDGASASTLAVLRRCSRVTQFKREVAEFEGELQERLAHEQARMAFCGKRFWSGRKQYTCAQAPGHEGKCA